MLCNLNNPFDYYRNARNCFGLRAILNSSSANSLLSVSHSLIIDKISFVRGKQRKQDLTFIHLMQVSFLLFFFLHAVSKIATKFIIMQPTRGFLNSLVFISSCSCNVLIFFSFSVSLPHRKSFAWVIASTWDRLISLNIFLA